MFPISYRDLELMLRDRGVTIDHTTIFRWMQTYAVDSAKRDAAATKRFFGKALAQPHTVNPRTITMVRTRPTRRPSWR